MWPCDLCMSDYSSDVQAVEQPHCLIQKFFSNSNYDFDGLPTEISSVGD